MGKLKSILLLFKNNLIETVLASIYVVQLGYDNKKNREWMQDFFYLKQQKQCL
jgi:hypothetical protein